MTVQELIDKLNEVEDKTKLVLIPAADNVTMTNIDTVQEREDGFCIDRID